MLKFFLFYVGAYGGMNAYGFAKVRAAFRPGHGASVLLALLFLLMFLAPFGTRWLERQALYEPARLLALAAFSWMVITLWFVSYSLLFDAWNLLVAGVGVLRPACRGWMVPLRWSVGLFGGLLPLLLLLAWAEDYRLRVETVPLHTHRLTGLSHPLRILQISDLHLGLSEPHRYFEQVLQAIDRTQPDLIVSTGDLVGGPVPWIRPLADQLARIQPPLGEYAVLGNHEFYAGTDASIQFLEAAGFHVLRGQTAELPLAGGQRLLLAGVDDPATGHHAGPSSLAEDHVLPTDDERPFTVLLKHQPGIMPTALGRFDLQLSGHSHGGQVFPFTLIVRAAHAYHRGLFHPTPGTYLYVSRGTGTWGAPLRLLAPREVTLFEITPVADSEGACRTKK